MKPGDRVELAIRAAHLAQKVLALLSASSVPMARLHLIDIADEYRDLQRWL